MSTRALIHIKDEYNDTLVTLYNDCDGYPDGLGLELYDIYLKIPKITNFEELTKRLVKDILSELDVLLYPPDTINTGEEYTYIVYPKKNKLFLKIYKQHCWDDEILKESSVIFNDDLINLASHLKDKDE